VAATAAITVTSRRVVVLLGMRTPLLVGVGPLAIVGVQAGGSPLSVGATTRRQGRLPPE
jgi:hypothetical protein